MIPNTSEEFLVIRNNAKEFIGIPTNSWVVLRLLRGLVLRFPYPQLRLRKQRFGYSRGVSVRRGLLDFEAVIACYNHYS